MNILAPKLLARSPPLWHIQLLAHPPPVFLRLPGLEIPSFIWNRNMANTPFSALVTAGRIHNLANELWEEVLQDHVLLQ